jgi:hypothetical protein
VLQAKASLNSVELARLRSAFENFQRNLSHRLKPYYTSICPHCNESSELRFTLYGLKKRCHCRAAIFVDSYVIREKKKGPSLRLCPKCLTLHSAEGRHCEDKSTKKTLFEKKEKNCEICGGQFIVDQNTPFYSRYVPLVSVGECNVHGPFFQAISSEAESLLSMANNKRASITFENDLTVKEGPKSNVLIQHGIATYRDLFSSRQLLYIKESVDLLACYDSIERLFLSLIISTSLEFNSMLCGYKGANKRRAGAIRHVFAYHAYSFPHTALENNPVFSKPSSGTLRKLYHDRIKRARLWAAEPRERNLDGTGERFVAVEGEVDYGNEVVDVNKLRTGTRKYLVKQGSATQLELESNSVDYIVTDPPYFDSVQYSDLAAFFRVWLRQFLPQSEAEKFDWDYGLSQSAVASRMKKSAADMTDHYEKLLSDIMSECYRVLRKEEGQLILSFHHWDFRGWAALTSALKQANFTLFRQYVVHSENPASVHIAGQKALSHDALLVFSPRQSAKKNDWMKPVSLDKSDSARFCNDCSNLLGWMLESELPSNQIYTTWKSMISG